MLCLVDGDPYFWEGSFSVMATNRTKIDFSLHTNTNVDNYNIYLGCTPPPPPGCQWQMKVDKATIFLFIYMYIYSNPGGDWNPGWRVDPTCTYDSLKQYPHLT